MRLLPILLAAAGLPWLSAPAQTNQVMAELGKYFEEFHVKGSFVLYDLHRDRFTCYNPDQLNQEFLPASTFKICNSLIALETGVIPDENAVIKWDGVKRDNPSWDRDNDLKSAFRNSVVWFYQELARRVGETRMQEWLRKAHYGNEKISGGIDQFWLRGELRITPAQQIDFLKRLYLDRLPFSPRTIETVKRVMVAEQTDNYTLRAKTGWASGNSVGWYVGYVETQEDVFFFSTCVQGTSQQDSQNFGRSRTEITRRILRALGVL